MSCDENPGQDADNAIVLYTYEDAVIEVTVRNAAGALVDLATAPGYATSRVRFEDTSPWLYKRTLSAGGSDSQIFVVGLGIAHIFVDSADVEPPRVDPQKSPFWWDCFFVLGGKKLRAITPDKLILKPTVFRFPGP
jgi:hypothetical protein